MALHPTRQFRRAIDDDPTKCILWVGAGLSAGSVRQGGKGLPLADVPDSAPRVTHEAIAQFYTFKLLESLKDERLMKTFLTLEKSCSDVYRAWRATEHYSLERMRQVLVKCRTTTTKWPPV